MAFAGLLALAACGPNEQERVRMAEAKRVECLDKFCEGEVEPKRDWRTQNIFKKNGQCYIGPKDYFNAIEGVAGFYWPNKEPLFNSGDSSTVKGHRFSDVAIEIFLTSRHRWPEPKAVEPWQGPGWEGRFEELQKQGLRIERERLSGSLERVRFFESSGQQYRHEYFLATNQRKALGMGAPGVACDSVDKAKVNQQPGCTGGEFWQPDVYADFRFSAKHANDWPAIHQEIIRILNLAKNVQP